MTTPRFAPLWRLLVATLFVVGVAVSPASTSAQVTGCPSASSYGGFYPPSFYGSYLGYTYNPYVGGYYGGSPSYGGYGGYGGYGYGSGYG